MIDRARAVALATALLLLAPSFPASAADQDFPLAETSPATGDTTLIPTPGYLQTIEDPFYGGLMTLVTGTPGEPIPGVPGRTWETRNQPGYPSYQSWNADGSILYLLFGGVFIDGHTLRPLPYPRPPGGTLPQWSPADPYVQIAASADWVREYDVRTGTVLSEVRLVGYTGAGTQIRTSPSNDGRLIGVKARRVDTSEWVCLGVDLESGRIVREISFDDWNFSLGGLEEDKARRCGVSPSGRYLFLNGHANGAYNDQGHFFDIATGDLVHKQRYNGGDRSFGGSECPGDHGDLGLDANGDDVFVGICHWTTVTQEWALAFKNVTVALRIRDGAVWAVGPGSSHTSCRNTARPGCRAAR